MKVTTSSLSTASEPDFIEEQSQGKDGDVEVHNDEVSLVGEPDTPAGDVTVMVSLQNTPVANDAVMAAWRPIVKTTVTPLPFQNGGIRLGFETGTQGLIFFSAQQKLITFLIFTKLQN